MGYVFGAQDNIDVVGNFELSDELVKARSAFVAYEDDEDVAGTEFGESRYRSVEEARVRGCFGGVQGAVELHHLRCQGFFAEALG